MWMFLFFGYMLFCMNWLIMYKLRGGWEIDLKVSKYAEVAEAVNYCIPLARGIATLPAAWIIAKLTHKYAVLVSLLLTTIAYPLVFVSSFSLFIIGRMIMAMGGTLLIIYIQPIISNFFTQKNKGRFSSLNGLAYSGGAVLLNAIFLRTSLSTYLVEHWRVTALVFAALTYVPFLGYWWLGVNFQTGSDYKYDATTDNDPKLLTHPDATYKKVASEKDSWLWFVHYSLLIVVSVLVSNYFPEMITKFSPDFVKCTKFLSWGSFYTLMFYCGCTCGMTMGMFNKYNVQKTPLLRTSCFLTLFFWIVILVAWLTTYKSDSCNVKLAGSVVCFVSVFLAAFFGMGIQSVSLYIPHEYVNFTKQKIPIFFALLWGMGYIIFSGLYVAVVLLQKINVGWSLLLLTLLVVLYYVLSCFIKEPKPDAPMWPWQNKNNLQMDTMSAPSASEVYETTTEDNSLTTNSASDTSITEETDNETDKPK